jgi:hypothetical protein
VGIDPAQPTSRELLVFVEEASHVHLSLPCGIRHEVSSSNRIPAPDTVLFGGRARNMGSIQESDFGARNKDLSRNPNSSVPRLRVVREIRCSGLIRKRKLWIWNQGLGTGRMEELMPVTYEGGSARLGICQSAYLRHGRDNSPDTRRMMAFSDHHLRPPIKPWWHLLLLAVLFLQTG